MRRKYIVLLFLICLVVAIGIFLALSRVNGHQAVTATDESRFAGSVMTRVNVNESLKLHGVEVIHSKQSRFDLELRRLIGNSDGELSSLVNLSKPISVIVINNSSKDIVGCSLKWSVSTPTGERDYPQIQGTPGVILGIKPIDTSMIGKTGLIPSGDVKLFSLDNTIDQIFLSIKSNRGSERHMTYAQEFQSGEGFRDFEARIKALLGPVSELSVTVDGVLFEDGTFVGEDTLFYFDSMRGRQQARSDFVSAIGGSNLDVSNVLDEYVSSVRGRRERLKKFDNSEDAFLQGYERQRAVIADEIRLQRSRVSDADIVNDVLRRDNAKRVVMRKVD